mmetsp:Transcript_10168/g.19926  ORF Transcript_10168/g.19926 Transcript_10168/m.19926 type:complete len:509 (-) Transcript_10168:23-1549(-)|eukprot:CAMPEP_0204901474 /NCGR_PEP_ID=MMETSP1397-20131031/3099_1 /ASSEMBLY_ACC=CAM_ASM_000891 /TAXON_ID=49980 /ORGANISM="Climacostomum Climacostomum virens, Strain Stock W-24" /LENGTH=508 /DNA_ID=CAMNT_0052069837 /DNA_START=233 /DNA_END=1759 /DNA_ORIENTATION=-
MADQQVHASPLRSRQRLLITQNETYIPDDIEAIDQEEERREVSTQLAIIRKRHDQTKEANLRKRKQVDKLKQELEQVGTVTSAAEGEQKSLEQRVEQLELSLTAAQAKQEEELQNKSVYEHMLDRMKKDRIALEIKAQSLSQNLRSARQVLGSEQQKSRKTMEAKFQSRLLLKELKDQYEFEKRQKEDRIVQLERNVRMRQEASARREERQKRQTEIAEAAAKADSDSQESRLRDNVLLLRFWYNFLKWKLENERNRSVDIEKAFQKIRVATGLQDVQEIVERFLTREQTYNEFISGVSEAEKKLETLKQQNTEAREELLQMQLDENGGARALYQEVEDLESQQNHLVKESTAIKEKLKKTIGLYDQVLEWGTKILKRLEINIESFSVATGDQVLATRHTLADMFESIEKRISEMLEPVLNQREEQRRLMEIQASKQTDQLVSEITTDEFLAKNIRIRPQPQREDTAEDEVDDEVSQLMEMRQSIKTKVKDNEELSRRKKAQQRFRRA